MGRKFVLGCDPVFDWNGSSDISYENPFNCGSNDIKKISKFFSMSRKTGLKFFIVGRISN